MIFMITPGIGTILVELNYHALNPLLRHKFLWLIQELFRRHGLSTVFVMADFLCQLFDRIVFLKTKKVVFELLQAALLLVMQICFPKKVKVEKSYKILPIVIWCVTQSINLSDIVLLIWFEYLFLKGKIKFRTWQT